MQYLRFDPRGGTVLKVLLMPICFATTQNKKNKNPEALL